MVPVMSEGAVRLPTTVEVLVTSPVKRLCAVRLPTTVEVEATVPVRFAGADDVTGPCAHSTEPQENAPHPAFTCVIATTD